MKQIVYTGTSNIRQLSSEDFRKMGLEDVPDQSFTRGVPVEFKNETAKALLEHGLVAGEFSEVEVEQPEASKSASTRDASRKGTDQS